jgi:Tfp pilus assembly protein PilX
MRTDYLKSRAGVSLITVLLFMLVATIAATATWKFISSEGFSSASRMLKREAYQSAQAGIENARSWMTFHGNDVGALIKQFQEKGKPINIDDQLRPLQKAGQNYHVWVTGVNTSNSTYKIKVLSAGETRNETSHTEVAIFNVDGLYRVKLPITQSSSNFSEAFHGELKSIDKLNIDKAVITQTPDVKNAGGQALNNLVVTDYLILDGSFYANNTNSINELYVTGDVGTCSGINVTKNMFLQGNFYPGNVKSTISGTLYAEGNINLRDFYPYTALTGGCYNDKPGDLEVSGNITADTLIYYDHGGAHTFTAKSSMVLNSIRFPDQFKDATVIDKIRVEHNVYVKGDSPGYMGDNTNASTCWNNDGRDAIPRTKFGSGDGDKIWLKGFAHYLSGPTANSFTICNDVLNGTIINKNCQTTDGFTCARSGQFKKWIGYKGQFLDSQPSDEETASWNANNLSKYRDKLEDRDDQCKRVKTPIQINKKIFELGLNHNKENSNDCDANIWSEWENSTELMNACYQKAKSNHKLYNNDWLILEFGTPIGWQKNKMGGTLNGNFIFKFNADNTNHQVNLPATSGNSKVLLYLPNGWPSPSNYNIEFAENSGDHRYFVFSEGDVVRFDMSTLENPMSGSVVMGKNATTGKCASFNTEGNNTLYARFDQELTEDLSDASIICDNDGSNTCSGMAATSSSSGGFGDDDGYDHYYVSMAPQLGVSLESQTKSFEKVDDSETLAPSFIILPRVISLPNDPYGTLGDYLNVLTLNKPQTTAPLAKTDLSLGSCTKVNSYNTLDISSLSSKMFSPDGSRLPKGTYKCDITADGYDETVPVWVSIDNKELRNLHQVSFAEASQEIGASETKDIYIRLQPKIDPIDLQVSCPTPPSSWTYEYVYGEVTTGETCTFTVSNPYNTERLLKLFTIKTEGATSGTMTFQILDGEDYIPTSPTTTGLYMSTTGSVNRAQATFEQLDTYCSTHADECPTEDERYNWKDCEVPTDEKWVEPDGTGFQTTELNNAWLVSSAINTTVKFIDVSKQELPCIVIIPDEDNTCTFTENQKNCILNASAKEKVHKVKFKFKNVESGQNPSFTVQRESDPKVCTYEETNEEHECIVNVYKEGKISMSIDTDNADNKDFKYWQCEGPSCPDHEKWNSKNFSEFTVSDNETVITVMYNEVDKHCFFDKFENSAAACNDLPSNERKEYCIDYCAPADHCESASITDGNFADAKWHLVRGKISMVDYENGILSVLKNGDITLMSTINADAGTHGTLKALVRLPKDDSQSGFLLGSDAEATSYLKLSVFIDDYGSAAVRVCNAGGTTCREESLSLSVTENDMVMIEAEITATEITVALSKGNESTKASTKFLLGTWSGYFEGSHVGLRMASTKFKIYGIGWKSTNYECFNTYPTIKCSFAAVAYYGVIPTTKPVKPWVGYSGWEGWNSSDCTEKYYYRGDDACNGDNYGYTTCEDEGFIFDYTSSGKHGYTDLSGTDIRTAKVGLECQSTYSSDNTEEMMWANDSAHCGIFWTGPQNVCSTTDKITGEISLPGSGQQSAAFTRAINMRSGQLKIDLKNDDNSEVWVWLYSQGTGDELYPSEHVSMNGETKTFNASDFETETGGFDISKVKSVHFENKGSGSVTVKNVSALCETAVRVKSCQAEDKVKGTTGFFMGGKTYMYVQLTAAINNRDGVDKYQIIAHRHSTNTTKTYEIDKADIVVYGTENAMITIPRGLDDINGLLSDWSFSLKLKSDGADYDEAKDCRTITGFTPGCKIEQPGPGEDPEVNEDAVHFHAWIYNCNGCSYTVTLDGDEKITGNCTAKTGPGLVYAANNRCDIKIEHKDMPTLTVGSTYKFRLFSPDGDFDECEKTFTVKENGTGPQPGKNVELDCDNLNVTREGTSVTIETKSTGCGPAENCTYNIEPAADGSGDYSDNKTINFSYDGQGNVTHKITVSNGTKSDDCTFNVSYSSSSAKSSSSSSQSSSSSAKSSSSSAKSSSSSVNSEFDCSKTTSIAKEQESQIKEGECVKYTMTQSETFRIGCWGGWATSTPVTIKIKNCNGSYTTISHNCNDWMSASTGKCDVYFIPNRDLKLKVNDWN